ncbi:heat stress transcription factor B-2a-like [Solanum stenotomum]|uniref:heat stress transcription factor B-2a-like n=1 Tax=Solanum stenotomum TaxID=172797 RepID=UPI0020D1BBB5|nr:heat stress transcription factor B-2a-like [Solanum stenotomum]XP_049396306.1 heat stress transcription factor B-2a-like [Solanum stenotomum]
MTPQPIDRNRGETTAGETQRSVPTPFLTKTYQLIEDQSIDDVISWNEDGSTFIVWNPSEFAKDLLPKYFKHNNFSSFVRQLNTYGFRKVVPDRWEFANDSFRRGERGQLIDIQRRKVVTAIATPSAATTAVAIVAAPPPPPPPPAQPPVTVSTSDSCEEQVISSNSSAGSTAELLGENERLRLENLQLNKELNSMKKLCGNIYGMMSNYAQPSSSGNQSAESSSPGLRPLDLLRTEQYLAESQVKAVEDGESLEEPEARLFGFSIGMKRVREGEEARTYHAQDLQLQQPGTTDVKSEASDQESNGESDERSWLVHCGGRNQRTCN